VRLWRTVPLDRVAAATEPGGPLWFPRDRQGFGRHDNPDLYGCLYAAEDAVSAVAEPLAAFRGAGRLTASMLTQLGRPLALAELELSDDGAVIDLDDPHVLAAEHLRPSSIATRTRQVTQNGAADLYRGHPDALGLRWWSTLEASWINWTLFDRATPALELVGVEELRLDDPVVREAAVLLGLAP
jgi:RES domain